MRAPGEERSGHRAHQRASGRQAEGLSKLPEQGGEDGGMADWQLCIALPCGERRVVGPDLAPMVRLTISRSAAGAARTATAIII